jgi:signal transduction histidine kinase
MRRAWDRGFPIRDATGNFYRVAGIAEDITERKRAEEEIRRHAARMEARAEISQTLAKVGLDVRTALDTIARYTAEVIGDVCVIRLLSSDRQWFNSAAFYHPKPETLALMKSLHTGTPIAANHGWLGQVLQTRQPLLIPIVTKEQLRQIISPEYLPFVEQVGMHSILILPLCVEGRVIGTLNLSRDQPEHPYTSDDQMFLQDLADRAALTIQNALLFEQVQSAHQRLQSLSRSLLEVQETERRYIARELHDEVGQVLTGIKLSLERSAYEPPDRAKISVSHALALTTELVGRVHDLSSELRPPMLDDFGLLSALKWLFGRYTSQFAIGVNFKHSRLEEQRFAPDIETAGYRIVQEALTNVARHAGVGAVDVDIQADENRVRIRVRDEGVGFDAHSQSASSTGGLSGMRERAIMLGGWLDVDSVPGAGTLLTAELPLSMS